MAAANVLLLHFEGADGSTTITDSATAKAMTAVGNAQIDTAQFIVGSASLLLDGAGDYVTALDSADFAFGTGDFTLQCYIRLNAKPASDSSFVIMQHGDTTNGWIWRLYTPDGTNLNSYFLNYAATVLTIQSINALGNLSLNTWYKLNVVRNGTLFKTFKDGVQVDGNTSDVDSMTDATGTFKIGSDGTGSFFNGWIDELSIWKGSDPANKKGVQMLGGTGN